MAASSVASLCFGSFLPSTELRSGRQQVASNLPCTTGYAGWDPPSGAGPLPVRALRACGGAIPPYPPRRGPSARPSAGFAPPGFVQLASPATNPLGSGASSLRGWASPSTCCTCSLRSEYPLGGSFFTPSPETPSEASMHIFLFSFLLALIKDFNNLLQFPTKIP